MGNGKGVEDGVGAPMTIVDIDQGQMSGGPVLVR